MYSEILSDSQMNLLPLIKQFNKEFYLVGGTAIALLIGHRRSIDFDLFKEKNLRINKILQKIRNNGYDFIVTRKVADQLNLIIQDVKVTFFQYPYPIDAKQNYKDLIKVPELLDLAVMKAFALGMRAKWKDYVDLYFIIKYHHNINEIIDKANSIYDKLFSEKQFRSQLCYFDDIDYTEEVDYIPSNPPDNSEIKRYLCEKALEV